VCGRSSFSHFIDGFSVKLLGVSFVITSLNPICCHFMALQCMGNVRMILDDAFTRRKHSGNYVYHVPKRSATLHVADTFSYVFLCGPGQ